MAPGNEWSRCGTAETVEEGSPEPGRGGGGGTPAIDIGVTKEWPCSPGRGAACSVAGSDGGMLHVGSGGKEGGC